MTQPAIAQSADYPNRLVRIVLPFPPGTSNDLAIRMLAERLSKQWGQPVVVENRPGASSIIGTVVVVKAPADGYTLLATISLLAQNHTLIRNLPYDALRDLVPVTELNRQQLAVYVRDDSPFYSVADLLSHARTHPGELKFATWGVGSTAHLMIEKIRLDKSAVMTHVPYKGGTDIVRAVLSDEVDVGAGDLRIASRSRLRVIAVTGPSRLIALPQVGTLAEAGVDGFGDYSWFGLFAPAGTPPEIVRKISDSINRVQSDPTLAKRLTDDMLATPTFTTPEEFSKIFQESVNTWASFIKATGVATDQ
ncbi:Bug family tripartite tricarboxylate transporter substrate binding protein [Phyllobacterium zundukense]|uniref:Tripartite tricarboxylate transporter substrate-binding protein n=1 Tax=Phyllobacterium zundukense TaxID=1867719 RepID=A0ACD4CY75_9HYPH|nr:tripartite tricarboxylate transporter substrate-binding protein [Phyllobacterium zundukense]UXN58484.1 tripartite tricarboxylate transporter substrate-binding protein [Phyllobacterium zundukense]